MVNQDIRRHARMLMRKNLSYLIPAVLLQMVLFTAVPALFVRICPVGGLRTFVLFLYRTVVCYTVGLGLDLLYVNAWEERPMYAMDIFQYFKDRRRFGHAVCLGFVFQLLELFISSAVPAVLSVVLGACYIWLNVELFMAPYCYVFSDGGSAMECLKGSWQMMKGNFIRYMGFMIMAVWWVFAVQIGLLVLGNVLILAGAAGNSYLFSLCLPGLTLLWTVAAAPYVGLVTTGFAKLLYRENTGDGN